MPLETSPLLESAASAPVRERYPHRTLRRACTIFLTCCLLVVVTLFLVQNNAPPNGSPTDRADASNFFEASTLPPKSWPESNGLSYESLQKIITDTPTEHKVRQWSAYYTSGSHLAGKNITQAEWTKDKWRSFGIQDSSLVSYDVLLNYPQGHRLALVEQFKNSTKIWFEASLEEDVLTTDPTTGLEDRVPTFHGYSASGNVTAEYVFANYGSFEDFEDLQKANLTLEGKIALVKYGGPFRGLKVKRAEQLGMVGVVIYSDPGDDGNITAEAGYKAYPDGPARNPSSVQRGSVEFLGTIAGDPTTPGYPSKPGCPRQDTKGVLPQIPTLPISFQDALPLLKALNGHGPKAKSFNKYWQTGGLGYLGVEYSIGPSPPHLKLLLVNEQEYVTTPIWNVIGIINGTSANEVLVLGNHRDAWVAGGAADPNSGSSQLVEVARSLGKALEKGWKPLRTIVLASWDAEEYGLVGSTEWVEEFLPWLSESAVAYINVDMGTSGSHFFAGASPLLNEAVVKATKSILSPNQTIPGQSIWELWSEPIKTLGSGSDYTAFQDFAGIPSVDWGFHRDPSNAVYHYHSDYDSFHWMDTYGDPGWHYHVAMAKLWGLLVIDLAESSIIQFNATTCALAFQEYVKKTKDHLRNSGLSKDGASLKQLSVAAERLFNASIDFEEQVSSLARQVEHAKNLPWYRYWKRVELFRAVQDINRRYKRIERQFRHPDGLDGRSWYKHTIFAPGLWTGYAGAVFPGLLESINEADVGKFYKWQGIITAQVYDVVKLIEM